MSCSSAVMFYWRRYKYTGLKIKVFPLCHINEQAIQYPKHIIHMSDGIVTLC